MSVKESLPFLNTPGSYEEAVTVLQQERATAAVTDDLPVPDQPYTFGQLQAAQAAGDRAALSTRDRPLLWLHLTDRAAGVAQVLAAARSLAVRSRS